MLFTLIDRFLWSKTFGKTFRRAETPLARKVSACRYLSNFYVFVLKFECVKGFWACFCGVFSACRNVFAGVKVMTRQLPFMLRFMFRSCFKKGLALLWNLRGMCKLMRSYLYVCLLWRYCFLEILLWILTIPLGLHVKIMFLSLGFIKAGWWNDTLDR